MEEIQSSPEWGTLTNEQRRVVSDGGRGMEGEGWREGEGWKESDGGRVMEGG